MTVIRSQSNVSLPPIPSPPSILLQRSDTEVMRELVSSNNHSGNMDVNRKPSERLSLSRNTTHSWLLWSTSRLHRNMIHIFCIARSNLLDEKQTGIYLSYGARQVGVTTSHESYVDGTRVSTKRDLCNLGGQRKILGQLAQTGRAIDSSLTRLSFHYLYVYLVPQLPSPRSPLGYPRRRIHNH